MIALGAKPSVDENKIEKTPSPIALMYGQIKEFAKSTGNELASVSGIFNFMESGTTSGTFATNGTVTTSSDGAIGVGVRTNTAESVDIDSLLKE